MTTGFDTRASGSQSFAAQPTALIQVNSGASAQSRGAQVIGGESIGGVEGGQYTQPGYVAAGLGKFFEDFLEPSVKRQQEAQFFKGYTEAQSGRALIELTDNGSPLTKIFGPSGFAQGAQFYTSRARVSEWSQATLADMDNLKKLAPEELSKHMAASAEGLMTGDPYADQQIQAGFLAAQGPVIQTVATARYAWQQHEATEALSTASTASADALQQIVTANAAMGKQPDAEAIQLQAQIYRMSMAKPEGLTEENYQKFLYGHLRNSMTKGNFYAVEIMRAAGVETVLTEDQQRGLTDAYERHGNRALDEAASQPDIAEALLRLDARVAQVEIGGEDPANVNDVIQEYAALNQLLRDRTGVAKDFFDADDIRTMGRGVIGARVARFKRDESARQRIEDREYSATERQREREEEAADKLAMVSTVWATGKVNDGLANGLTNTDFDQIAYREFSAGNYGSLGRAFQGSGFASSLVSKQVQQMTIIGLGDKFTKSAETAYGIWKGFNAVNPGMAQAYFGDDKHFAWSSFDAMQAAGDKDVAYRDAFSNVGKYGVASIPPERRREYAKQIEPVLSAQGFKFFSPTTWGNEDLTPVSRSVVQQAITDQFARIAEHSPRDVPSMVQQALNASLNSGKLERYGPFAWVNTRGGGKPMSALLGMNKRDSGAVISGAVSTMLKKQGVTSMAAVRVERIGDNLVAEHMTPEGLTVHTPIMLGFLQQVAQQAVEAKRNMLAGNRAEGYEAAYQHAQRRIPGESVAQRVLRQNRELAEWRHNH